MLDRMFLLRGDFFMPGISRFMTSAEFGVAFWRFWRFWPRRARSARGGRHQGLPTCFGEFDGQFGAVPADGERST